MMLDASEQPGRWISMGDPEGGNEIWVHWLWPSHTAEGGIDIPHWFAGDSTARSSRRLTLLKGDTPVSPIASRGPLRVARTADEDWHKLVCPSASPVEVRLSHRQFLAEAKARPRPRRWTDADATPGWTFWYSAHRPGVYVVVVGTTVVGVLTRGPTPGRYPRSSRLYLRSLPSKPRQPRPVVELADYRWGYGQEAA